MPILSEKAVIGILRTEGRSYFLLKKLMTLPELRAHRFLVTPTTAKTEYEQPYFSFPREIEATHYVIEYIAMQDPILVEQREAK